MRGTERLRMRRVWVALLVLILAAAVGWADETDITVQGQPFRGAAALDGGVWYFEINALAGAIGLRRDTITGHPVPPASFSFTYKGRTFQLPVRQQGGAIFVDAKGFVEQIGGSFIYTPAVRRVTIVVPNVAGAPTPTPVAVRPTSPPPNAHPTPAPTPPIAIETFSIMVGAQQTSGTPYRVHLDLTNTSTATLPVTLRILDGTNVANEQGPVSMPPGKHPAEWVFYAALGAPQFKAQVLVNNQVVASRDVDKTEAAPTQGGAPETPEPTSTTPPGF